MVFMQFLSNSYAIVRVEYPNYWVSQTTPRIYNRLFKHVPPMYNVYIVYTVLMSR